MARPATEEELLSELTAKQEEVAAAESALQAAEQADLDLIMVLPTDTWESIATRLGVTPQALYEANQGVGGCTTMQSIPVGARLNRPE